MMLDRRWKQPRLPEGVFVWTAVALITCVLLGLWGWWLWG
jgi:hypothetical protein